MGKEEYRFKLSDLMPNSWFYKLKEMRNGGKSRARKGSKTQGSQNFMDKSQIQKTESLKTLTNQRRNPPSPSATTHQTTNRPSYYIPTKDREERLPLSPHKSTDIVFPIETPRKSDKRHKKKPATNSNDLISSVSSVFTCKNQSFSAQSSALPTISDRLLLPDEELKDRFFLSGESLSSSDLLVSDLNPPPLPPILTKPRLFTGKKQSPKQGNLKRSPFGSQQVKLRIKSPKLAMKIVNKKKKGLAESFVVVKSSSDPQRDFRESMVEMIVENNLCSLKDFEELLACYLSLNSSEYHDLIVQVFKQIWFDLSDLLL